LGEKTKEEGNTKGRTKRKEGGGEKGNKNRALGKLNFLF
jgi:hypothetical protein